MFSLPPPPCGMSDAPAAASRVLLEIYSYILIYSGCSEILVCTATPATVQSHTNTSHPQLDCIALHCTALYCTVLNWTALYSLNMYRVNKDCLVLRTNNLYVYTTALSDLQLWHQTFVFKIFKNLFNLFLAFLPDFCLLGGVAGNIPSPS